MPHDEATWPSGKAEACKAFTPGSNPGVASSFSASMRNADMAQLVEHHLAKVGVAGSNPVVRSRTPRAPLREPFFVHDKEEAKGARDVGLPLALRA